jgi:hypothetical protein
MTSEKLFGFERLAYTDVKGNDDGPLILPSRAEAAGMLNRTHDKLRHDQEKAFGSAKVGPHVYPIESTSG